MHIPVNYTLNKIDVNGVIVERHTLYFKIEDANNEAWFKSGFHFPQIKGKLDKVYLQWHEFDAPVYTPYAAINSECGYNQLSEYSVVTSNDGYSYCYFGGNEILTGNFYIYVTDSTGSVTYKMVLEVFPDKS